MAVRLASDRFGWIGPVLTATALATVGIGVAAAEQGRSSQLRGVDVVGIALLLGGSLPLAFARRWAVVAYLVALASIGAYQALG
jgi:hypothetical protein